jgi:Arm DNA-binding domain
MTVGYITKRAVDALKPGGGQSFLWDAGDGSIKGFGVRITSAGVKSYVYQYRLGGRSAGAKRYTIGRHGEFTPDAARARAIELAEQVRRNIDPIEAEANASTARAEKAQEARDLAFSAYAARFLERHVQPNTPDSHGFSEAILRLHVVPVLRQKPLPTITRRDVLAVIERIDASHPSVRRNCFAVMRKLFNWARARDAWSHRPLSHRVTGC